MIKIFNIKQIQKVFVGISLFILILTLLPTIINAADNQSCEAHFVKEDFGVGLVTNTDKHRFFNNQDGGTTGTCTGVPTSSEQGSSTTYKFKCTGNVFDGEYAIVSHMEDAYNDDPWFSYLYGQGGYDHTTNDGTGRMMFINADTSTGTFYSKNTTGLNPTNPITISFAVENGLRDLTHLAGKLKPNLDVDAVFLPSNTTVNVLTTGEINNDEQWHVFTQTITPPAGNTDTQMRLDIKNAAGGGQGNDFVLDDITVSQQGTCKETNNDALSVNVGQSANVDVLANDPDFDTTNISSLINVTAANSGTAQGTITFDSATGELTYTPTVAEENTTVTAFYEVCSNDTTPVCVVTQVDIEVNPALLDSDGDGVFDIYDKDDDNDGILDINEAQCVPAGTHLSDYSSVAAPVASGGYSLDGQTVSTNIPGLNISHSYITDAPKNFHVYSNRTGVPSYVSFQGVTGNTPGPSTYATTTFVYTFNNPLLNLEVDLRDLDGNNYINGFVEQVKIEGFSNGSLVKNKEVILGNDVVAIANDFYENQTTSTSETSLDGRVFQKFLLPVDEVRITMVSNWPAGNVTYFSGGCFVTDTDNDGTPDYLDLDSDNDGCFDAVEAAGNFTPANLEDAQGVTTGTGSPATGNQNLGNTVDGDGIPNSASPAGQAIGTSQDPTQKDAACCTLITTEDSVSGLAGTTFNINVLANDTLNSDTPPVIGTDLDQVTISEVGTWDTGITLDPQTGQVTVDTTVPAGTYNLEYQVCANNVTPALCETQTVEITVNPNNFPVITTHNETIAVGDTLNLLDLVDTATDSEDGDITANVTVSNNGSFDPDTPGTYTITFTVTDSDGNTTTQTATVVVEENPIVATPDSGSVPATGGTAVPNVLGNDTLNGNPVTLSNITLSQVSTTNTGVTLDPTTGAVSVSAGTPAGTYTLEYRICETASPTNCTTSTVTITVEEPSNNSGSSSSSSSGSSSVTYVCKDPKASNYSKFGRHKKSLCKYTTEPTEPTEEKMCKEVIQKQCPIFTQHMTLGDRDGYKGKEKQNSGVPQTIYQVSTLQKHLKLQGLYTGSINGKYDTQTFNAVKAWQTKHSKEVLKPWGMQRPSGRFYQSSERWMNIILGCNDSVTLDNGKYLSKVTENVVLDYAKTECKEEEKTEPKVQPKQCPIFTQHTKKGDRDGQIGKEKQNPGISPVIKEVKLLQQTLKKQGFNPGPTDGIFGTQTHKAVQAWQTKHSKEVLKPWGMQRPSGRFYQSSERWMNELLGCHDSVTLDNGTYLTEGAN